MTKTDVMNIFDINIKNNVLELSNGSNVSIKNFLDVAGFEICEPNKIAMLEFDGGKKGYKDLIEQGNFEVTQ